MGVRTHVEDKECSAGGADQVNHYGKSLSCFLSLWIVPQGKTREGKVPLRKPATLCYPAAD